VQLRHLDEPLDDITGIEVANGLDELLQRLIVLLLLIEIVSMLLADLSNDLSWEAGIVGDLLCLLVQVLLQ
jgi:hypothetical protein